MNGSLLRFYVHEGHRHHHHPLWEWLLQEANELGIRGGSAFKVVIRDRKTGRKQRIDDLVMPMPGHHNALNACAAMAVA